jgi:hypothetical protein
MRKWSLFSWLESLLGAVLMSYNLDLLVPFINARILGDAFDGFFLIRRPAKL